MLRRAFGVPASRPTGWLVGAHGCGPGAKPLRIGLGLSWVIYVALAGRPAGQRRRWRTRYKPEN